MSTPYEPPLYSSTNDFNKKPDLLSKLKVLTKNIDNLVIIIGDLPR
jgi:hypothetical protein